MTQILNEVKRSQSLSKSKSGDEYAWWNQLLGKNRHERRLHQKVSHSVSNYNKLDMNKLFKEDILDVNIEVKGETDTYLVKISFSGVLDNFNRINKSQEAIRLNDVSRAITIAFNQEDIYFHCECPDWKYRHAYWAIKNGVNSDVDGDEKKLNDAKDGPFPKKTNPNDSKGGMCKHVAMVMSNNSWIMKVASVIRNYILYMQKNMPDLYHKVIYPALFGEEWSEPEQQMTIYDLEEPDLTSSENELDTSNKWAKTKSQFKQGNKYRYRPANNDDEIEGQKSFDFESEA